MSKYSYSFENSSVLDGFMVNYLAKPLTNLIPAWVPANIITIISNACMTLAFVISIQCLKGTYHLWFLIPILTLTYLVGDNIDGFQARRTKTSSPLGEFLDHFLDTFVNGEMSLALFFAYGIRNPFIISFALFAAYSVQTAAFWERYKCGHMHFGKFSSTESIATVMALVTAAYFKPVRDFAAYPVVDKFPFFQLLFDKLPFDVSLKISDIVLVVFSLITLINTVVTLVRTKGASLRFYSYLIVGAVISFAAAVMPEDPLQIPYLTIILFHVSYLASLLSAIVMKEKDHFPDFVLTAVMLIMILFNIVSPILNAFCFLYIVVVVSIRASIFFSKNKQYWVWRNPELEEEKTEENKQ